ncbi:MAG: DMT family transporter [Anaerolineales bacterium]
MTARDASLLFVLAALWGASFLFIRVAVPALGPFPLVGLRVALAGIILLGYALAIHQAPDWRAYGPRFLFLGLFNNAIPFTLIATAQLTLTASLAALLNATTPLFSAIIAALWIQDRLTAPKVIGLGLGIVGVGIIVGAGPDAFEAARAEGVVLMLAASCSYGVGVVFSKVAFTGVSPVSISTGQLLSSSLMILPLAAWHAPQEPIGATPLAAALGLATLSTAVAYLIYFHLVKHAGPTNAASVTLLIPFFSSLWGAVFLGERLLANEIAGFGVILVALLLVTGLWQNLPLRKRATQAAPIAPPSGQ